VGADREAPGEPDVEIGAAARAKKLRFRKKPKVEVNTRAARQIDPRIREELERVEAEGGSHTERENLPDEVEPGVTYRNVRVSWRAGARLRRAGREGRSSDPK
jgi:hypothetical protein